MQQTMPRRSSWFTDWDFSGPNVFALVAGGIMLFAFFFMPWFGTYLGNNGARIMADALYGTAGSVAEPFIWLVPVVAVAVIGVAIWGSLAPERARLASPIAAVLGFVNLFYFLPALARISGPEAVQTAGIGFWAAFICTIALILQPILAMPAFTERRGPQRAAEKKSRFRVPSSWVPYLFLLPPLALYLVWIIAPTIYTMYLSLTNWDGVSAPEFIGIANFQRLFTKDRNFVESLVNNLRWLIVFILVPTSFGLLMAIIFNNEMYAGRVYKVSFFAPLVLSLPVIGLIWAWLYNPRLGLINSLLVMMGVQDPPGWLGDRAIAIWCVIAAAVWRQVGYVMILYLAGLKNIDPSYVDAAKVDGAGRMGLFRHVVFPLLAPVTTIVVVISIIDSLRAFDLVSIMTRGGQGTQVLANFMYMEAFNNYRMGYGAAIAVVLFGISLVFIAFYLSRVIRDELEY
jgi:multiple sugar transport system permease protein